ncbi:MAG: hypothetical protein FJ102_07620 [Deltaproteobacteria bacterium]|nr:hypothetical protein [Deltaproteobacteria bacterium]
MPALAPEIGWEATEFCYLDPDFSDSGEFIIAKAMSQINENIDIVEDFFDRYINVLGAKVSGACVVNLLTAASAFAGYLHFERVDRRGNPCNGLKNWYGCTVPGAVVIQLAQQFVKAVYNSRAAESCGSGDGACACVTAELAAMIVHETCHSCLLDEIPAYLLTAHYKYEFASRNGYTSSCCTGHRVMAWNERVWTEARAQSVANMPSINQNAGEWRLASC